MIPRSLALVALWVALWGEVSVANVASGVVVVGIVSWLFVERAASTYQVRPWNALTLLVYVLYNLVVSSVRVVAAVVAPSAERTTTSVQQVQLRSGSPFIGAIVANAVTLTPGTMSLDLDRASMVISIHVLGEVTPDKFAADILRLEQLVADAVKERRWT